MRIESGRPSHNGGWLHLHDAPEKRLRPLPPVTPKPPTINATRLMAEFSAATPQQMLEALADTLGVDCGTLVALGVAWAAPYCAFAFPMSDGFGNWIGIRLRDNTGRKWAVTGSRAGIFLPRNVPVQKKVFISEGPTDCAAALTLGLYSIGRPSCSGGNDYIQTAVQQLGIREVVILSDCDAPGLRGSEILSSVLRVASCVMVPPTKDIREFLNLGGTAELINSFVQNLIWNTPSTS